MIEERPSIKVYVDTNIFLAAFEAADETAKGLQCLFEVAKRSPDRIVTSELSLAERMGKECSREWAWQSRFYLGLLVASRFIDLRPVTREILLETGQYRRAARRDGRNVKLPDAIHICTAVKSMRSYVFTADERFLVPAPLRRIQLDDAGMTVVSCLHA